MARATGIRAVEQKTSPDFAVTGITPGLFPVLGIPDLESHLSSGNWTRNSSGALAQRVLQKGMYLRDALGCCRDLERSVAGLYDTLASQHANNATLSAAWRALAEDERGHARQLDALLAVLEALDDDGPFLVGVGQKSSECATLVRDCERRINDRIDEAAAVDLCVRLENSELDTLLSEMRELARPALKRLTDRLYRSSAAQRRHRERVENLARLAAGGAAKDTDSSIAMEREEVRRPMIHAASTR